MTAKTTQTTSFQSESVTSFRNCSPVVINTIHNFEKSQIVTFDDIQCFDCIFSRIHSRVFIETQGFDLALCVGDHSTDLKF